MKRSLAWAALSLAGLAACGGNTSSGGGSGDPLSCGEHPLECPTGQTCWFAEGGTFACFASGSGTEGDTCAPLVDQPTCGDGLLCVKKAGAEAGACSKLCDPTNSAAQCGDLLCLPVALESGEQTHACL
jgi:hypothetical protein